MPQELVSYFQSHLPFFLFSVFVLSLAVGSFLNVVIYRLPVMLQRSWKSQCSVLFELENSGTEQEHFNLVVPRSRCPSCGHLITAVENIPVISYLLQRGRCKHCDARISARYPVIELLTAVMSVMVAWQFGVSWQAVFAILLTCALISLTFIDIDTQLLPDNITLPFLWLGLLLNLNGVFTDIQSSIIGAAAGYLALWSVYHLFKLATGKEGMGFGDFKLLALLGAWMGWQMLPLIIILSSVVGAVIGITMIALRGHDRNVPIPFGPYLATAGWLALMWGEPMTQAYLNWITPG
jgi:leader peptidase (prepilin peptidase)/N-methyltransferase